jgi:hypothetical protein
VDRVWHVDLLDGYALHGARGHRVDRSRDPLGEFTLERIVVGDKNGARLPAYHRLDLAGTYGWRFGNGRSASLGVSLFNTYNRYNVWYKEFTAVEGEIVENDIGLMRFTLNASLSIRF